MRLGDLLLVYKYRADARANMIVVKSSGGKGVEVSSMDVALQHHSRECQVRVDAGQKMPRAFRNSRRTTKVVGK